MPLMCFPVNNRKQGNEEECDLKMWLRTGKAHQTLNIYSDDVFFDKPQGKKEKTTTNLCSYSSAHTVVYSITRQIISF